ncbi:MAG: hypothetical protein ACLP2Y_12555 [Limisphaerales bacterium]
MNISKDTNVPALGCLYFESYGISDSSTDKAAAEFLADGLERLMSLPLDTLEQVKHWDTQCADVMTVLETRFPCFEIERHVWHFFADADIRQINPGYRQQQHQAIADYVTRLRNGCLRSALLSAGSPG